MRGQATIFRLVTTKSSLSPLFALGKGLDGLLKRREAEAKHVEGCVLGKGNEGKKRNTQ